MHFVLVVLLASYGAISGKTYSGAATVGSFTTEQSCMVQAEKLKSQGVEQAFCVKVDQ